MTRRGRFLTFEGIDGAGKSTQHQWLIEYLRRQGREVVATREPGGTPLGEKLREVLLSESMHLETEALLMFAARREHIEMVIEPSLARGAWVVCDRFVDASIAYQGGGRGLSQGRLTELVRWTVGELAPDQTFLFDLPVGIALQRLQSATPSPDRFEREQVDFFERVRASYLDIAQKSPRRVCVIDACLSQTDIQVKLEQLVITN
jgi:dTMP kinase